MWIQDIKYYTLIFELQKEIKIILYDDYEPSKDKPFLSFDEFNLEVLVKNFRDYSTYLYSPEIDNLNEEDIRFVKQTLRRLNIHYKTTSSKCIELKP